ncbi:hypothetical protein RQP53_04895 [Paucibacter sp. APW11]|uniref:Transmembrane protein n=1 Tax=Roseateles aquae TaxID=3077235 RepID=A0ABU3P7S7_9BURK|nr:hypothetical protein [Paucibacter sp. APW11]MDT8998604.1 hypothetical protein [Paucibacter sp. APW11]
MMPLVQTPRSAPRRDWWSKTLAGALGGLVVALLCSALFNHLAQPGLTLALRSQLAMWMVAPIWLTLLALSFGFSSGRRAWLSLGGATALLALAFVLLER